MEMDPVEFERIVEVHTLPLTGIVYPFLAMAGETGEACNIVKKVLMVRLKPEWVTDEQKSFLSEIALRDKLIDELGDVLFYLTRCALNNGVTLEQLMINQANKLNQQSEDYGRIFLK